MLEITVALSPEGWDEKTEQFVEAKTQKLQLEHSLVSISKWESKWCKAFLSKTQKTDEEVLDYVRCMTITQNVNPEVYNHLSVKNIEDINKYIKAPMTATVFSEDKTGKSNREVVTSELIYFWMIAQNIPSKYETWHLNRLLTLIRICSIKNAPPKKMSKREALSRNAAMNAARRKQLNSKG